VRYTIDGEALRELTKQWEDTTLEVVEAVKAVVIVEAEEMEDSKAEETGAQLQAPNNNKMKFFPHGIGRERQTVSYDTVKDCIVQVIQKTYKNGQDSAVSIRDLMKKDLTPLQPTSGVASTDPILASCHSYVILYP
jgi:hypothetical protein